MDKDRGALRVAAADSRALALGIRPGITLADARASLPELDVRPLDVEGDAALLKTLLADFGRFSPMIALDPPWGLMLDVTGCAHLFGGEARLVAAVRKRATAFGLGVRTSIARTPQTARALCRFGSGGVTPEGRDAEVAGRLPVAALELTAADHQALRRAGLVTVAEVAARRRDALAARFGADFPDRLDRLLGRVDARISPVRPAPPVRVDRVLFEPVTEIEQVEAVLADLLTDLEKSLETRGLGARRLVLTLHRIDGDARRVTLRTARPGRKAGPFQKLWRERLASLSRPLEPGFGFDHLSLGAEATSPLAPEQTGLDRPADHASDLRDLIDRLSARLGPGAVVRIRPLQSHLPERACRLAPAQAAKAELEQEDDWPEPPGVDEPPARPLHLFDPPQPIEAVALAPDSPPARFRWRRVDHRVARAEGPERIEAEWWIRRERVRDYYRVEDDQGRRFWLFRAGSYGEEPAPRWYVHGLFA